MKNKKKFYIYLLLTLIVMIIIFFLSQQDGNNSSETSFRFANTMIGRLAIQLAQTFLPMFEPIDVIRETAHAFEFFVLAIFSYSMFFNYGLKRLLIINVILGAIYALSDEIHQIFIPYRTFQLFDILMDSLGVLVGSLIMLFIYRCKDNSSRKNK